ncbi:MAG: YafY family transcriptional regulator [Verrucomicrobia bacterium]|nr:YafY family transcriptional regulator [Verrucomicrobiota bacterium]
MNRIDRLVAILIYLQGRRVTRAEDIADEFATSIRTVYRDIAALAEAGVPIVGEAGVGYSIVRGYHLPPVHFTTEEATALITANLLMDRFADKSLMSPMGSALAKIRAVLPPDHQDHITRLEGRMSLPTSPRPTKSASLFSIQKALAERTLLRISYRGAGKADSMPREIEPMGLTYYGDRWHLIAWCRLRQDYRDFRTDRIQELAVLSARFEPRTNFSLDEFLQRTDQPRTTVTAVIRVDPVTAERVRKEAPFKIVKEERTENDVGFTIEAGDWDWYMGWFLSFGSRVTIIEPEALRARLFEVARATANHHGAGASTV